MDHSGISEADPLDAPQYGRAADEMRERACALVERLTDLGEKAVALSIANRRLQAELEHARAAAGSRGDARCFDDARHSHPWPLLDDPSVRRESLGFYEHRPDDDLVAGAAQGRAFFDQFALLGDAPRFDAAVDALNAAVPVLRLVPDTSDALPDVSIVIPVYGQLAYTLNCVAALLAHASVFAAEIIVVDDASPDRSADKLAGIAALRVVRARVNGGFIAACNAGAALARGGTIVLLNNDTRVLPGWLDELVGSFTLFPRAGLVGSKLLYPDGTLQECGGIVWRCGNAWNYGRNDDPNRPQYSFARQVDFVSGASIALPARLWRELGGLDAYFAPAYYEDTDLAFRVRAHGLQTWVQPKSRLIHYEGKTSGTDVGKGVKAYQVVNAGKFHLRWREALLSHHRTGDGPFFARERQVLKRALVIDATCITPKQDAGSVYAMQAMGFLQQFGYKVVFLPQDNLLYQPVHTDLLERHGIECVHLPYHASVESYLASYGWLFDVVLVFRASVLAEVVELLREHASRAPIMFNSNDLNFLRLQRAAELSGSSAAIAEAEAIRLREVEVMRRADCVFTHSTREAEVLRREVEAEVAVIPLMADLHGTAAGFARRRDLCFLGGFGHPPNADAVAFFVAEVMPLVWREDPAIRFIIAGANPTAEVSALASERVIVTGLVDDLRDVFDPARVFVCPLRFGAGTKGKIVMAMSYGIPVVTTSIGAEGMELRDGADVLVADTPAQLARASLLVYRDAKLWARLSAAGLRRVRDHWSLQAGQRVLREGIEAAHRHRMIVPSSPSEASRAA